MRISKQFAAQSVKATYPSRPRVLTLPSRDGNDILASCQLSVGSAERLGSSGNSAYILGRGQTLVMNQIFEEVENVGIERSLLAVSDEAENSSGSIRALEEIPRNTSDRNRSD